ncbi:MAG TPA: fatty acyl-AMP ligase, partial [Gemmataceae bacterium]|nr:fatty acyl-AMP ligase [Gemmataceae bacterium]
MVTLPHSSDETILDRLRRHAESRTDQIAYRFLRDDGGSHTLTFGQLNRRVRSLAARLSEHTSPGDRALLMYPPGLEFIEAFLACLAAGIIAIPAYPPRPNRKAERHWAILEDATPSLILISSQVAPKSRRLTPTGSPAAYLVTDEIELNNEDDWPRPTIGPETVAFLQYSSGSTGTPRGVIVTHGNLMANEKAIQIAFRHTQEDVVVGWLPVFHDMGLIGNVLQPLYVGFPAILFSPTSFLREPVRWLRAISEYRGTTAGAPNFAYDHCVRSIKEEQKEGLNLRSWKVAYNGAEPVRADTLERFAAAFASCGFRKKAFFPCYGLAEATLFVSGGPAGVEPRRRCAEPSALEGGQILATEPPHGRWHVGSGRPAEGTKIVVIDPSTKTPVPAGRVGELWVSSPSIAAGYWGREVESNSAFRNYLANGEGPFLSTGDLGFIDSDEVFVTGRSKDLIIIRGRNIYPQDVEAAIERVLPFVEANSCAAFTFEENGHELLGVVIEADRGLVRIARTVVDGNGKAEAANVELRVTVGKVRQVIGDEFEVPVHAVVFVRP